MLNERERYWQDFYNVLSENGLNCRLTTSNDRSGKLSDETKKKMSKNAKQRDNTMFGKINKGVKHSEERRIKHSEAQKKLYESGYEHPFKGKKHSEDSKIKMSESIKNRYKEGYVNPNKGKKVSEESKIKNSESKKKLYASGYINPKCKKVINIETGEVYISAADCARKTGYKKLRDKLCGIQINNTPFKYL
jgi:hypothetical protein